MEFDSIPRLLFLPHRHTLFFCGKSYCSREHVLGQPCSLSFKFFVKLTCPMAIFDKRCSTMMFQNRRPTAIFERDVRHLLASRSTRFKNNSSGQIRSTASVHSCHFQSFPLVVAAGMTSLVVAAANFSSSSLTFCFSSASSFRSDSCSETHLHSLASFSSSHCFF